MYLQEQWKIISPYYEAEGGRNAGSGLSHSEVIGSVIKAHTSQPTHTPFLGGGVEVLGLGYPTQDFICKIPLRKSQKIFLENSPSQSFPLFLYNHYFELKIRNHFCAANSFYDNLINFILT